MALHTCDIMDWEPVSSPVILHRSTHIFNQPVKRTFEQMSDNSEPLGRGFNELQPFLPSHRDSQSYTATDDTARLDAQSQSRWHWLSYSVSLVYNLTRDSFNRAYQGAKRRLCPVFPPRRLSNTLRRFPHGTNTARAAARRSPPIRRSQFPGRCIPGSMAITVHESQALCDMPCTYPDTPAARNAVTQPSSQTREPLLSTDSSMLGHDCVYPEPSMDVTSPLGIDPNPLFDELDIIHAKDTQSAVHSDGCEAAAPAQTVPLVGPRTEHNILLIDTQTPIKPRKNVTFVASPRTGRPVTGTKKFVIGESMDFPSPLSSRNESSFLSPDFDSRKTQQQIQYDSRTAMDQLQQEFYSSLNASQDTTSLSNGALKPRPVVEGDTSTLDVSFTSHHSAPDQKDVSDIGSISENGAVSEEPHLKTLNDTSASDVSHAASTIPNSRTSEKSSTLPIKQEEPKSCKSSSSVPKREGDDDVFVLSEQKHEPQDDLCVRKRRSSSSLNNHFGALELSIKPVSLSTSTRRTSARRASLEAKRKEEEDRAQAALAKEKAQEAENRKQELKEQALREGIPRIPLNIVIPPLSSHAQNTVSDALAKGMQTQVALAVNGNPISRRDIGKVLPTGPEDDAAGWLNDEVISAYLQIVVEHGHRQTQHKRNTTPAYHAFNTYFYTNLQKRGHEGVKRWAKKAKIGGKDLLNVDMVFIPVNVHGNHWTMAIVQPKRRRIEYFDSLHYGNTARQIHQNIKLWLKGELGSAFTEAEWEVREQEGFHGKGGGPTQTNGSDCGVFAITTAKMMMLGVSPMAVKARDIPLQRQRIVAEVLNGGFTGEFEPKIQFD